MKITGDLRSLAQNFGTTVSLTARGHEVLKLVLSIVSNCTIMFASISDDRWIALYAALVLLDAISIVDHVQRIRVDAGMRKTILNQPNQGV